MANKKPPRVKKTKSVICHCVTDQTNAVFDGSKVPVYEAATDEKFKAVISALDDLKHAREAEDNFISLYVSRLNIQG